MLKKNYDESLESLLLPSKKGNHFNIILKREKKNGKKGKCLVDNYLIKRQWGYTMCSNDYELRSQAKGVQISTLPPTVCIS